jgi:hypothetical protein
MSTLDPADVAPPLTLRHNPELSLVIVPLEFTVHDSGALPLQVYTSAVAFGDVELPLTLRHSPAPLLIVPLEFTVQFCTLLPSQVPMSAMVFGVLDSPVVLRHSPELFPVMVLALPPPPWKLDGL